MKIVTLVASEAIMALDMEATEATEVPLLTLEFTQGAMAEPDMGDKSKLKGCDRNFSYE